MEHIVEVSRVLFFLLVNNRIGTDVYDELIVIYDEGMYQDMFIHLHNIGIRAMYTNATTKLSPEYLVKLSWEEKSTCSSIW